MEAAGKDLGATDVEARVLGVAKEILALDDEVSVDASIREDLARDSLDQITLFMALEDEFGGHISEEEAERMATLRDVVDYVCRRLDLVRDE